MESAKFFDGFKKYALDDNLTVASRGASTGDRICRKLSREEYGELIASLRPTRECSLICTFASEDSTHEFCVNISIRVLAPIAATC